MQYGDISILWNYKWPLSAILDVLGSHGTTHNDHFMMAMPCENLVMIGLVICSTNYLIFCRSSLTVLFTGPKFQFLEVLLPKFRGTSFRPPKATCLLGITRFIALEDASCIVYIWENFGKFGGPSSPMRRCMKTLLANDTHLVSICLSDTRRYCV